MKIKPWHGKLNHIENQCPHCGAKNEYSDITMTVMELSAQHYKLCTKCNGEFVDTYLIHFIDSDEGHPMDDESWWSSQCRWENEDHIALFDELRNKGALIYEEDNPDEDSDYYDIPPQSIHFIKGEDNE